MEELAEVVSIEDNKITLVSQVKSSCSSCSQVDTCGSGQIAKAIPHKTLSFTLPHPQSIEASENKVVHVGDCVILSLPEADVLQSAWQVYLIPLIGLFIFSAFGQWLLKNGNLSHELQALLLGLIGGYLGYRLAKYVQNKPNKIVKLQPKIVRVLAKPIDTTIIGNKK